MAQMDNIKENLKAIMKEHIINTVRPIVRAKFPTARYIYFNPGAEYNDEDDSYYSSLCSFYDSNHNELFDFFDYQEDEEYEEVVELVQSVLGKVDGPDFVWAFGSLDGGNIDLGEVEKNG